MHKSHDNILKAGFQHTGSRFLGDSGEEDHYSKGEYSLKVKRSSGRYYLYNDTQSHPIDRGDSHEELMRSPYFEKEVKESMSLIDRANKLLDIQLHESFNKILGVVGKSKEGVAYMIHKTIQGINSGTHPDKAFRDAAEDENYYGQRSDIVKDRKLAIDTLHRFGHKVNDFTENINLEEGHNHEDIANSPPKFIPSHHHEIWKGLVLRSKHTSYGAAVNHYKNHMFKHGSYAATKLAKITSDQTMTAEALDTNPNVSSSTDKLNHTDKTTTTGLLRAKIRRYKKFGSTHSALVNGAKSHNVSSRLSSQ